MKQKHILFLGMAALLALVLLGCGLQSTTSGLTDEYIGETNNESYELKDQKNTDISEEEGEKQYELMVSEAIAVLEFRSLEEFLVNYSLVEQNATTRNGATIELRTNFAALETLYVPINIPEEYSLYKIKVTARDVGFWYVHRDDMISEETIREAIALQRHYLFGITRWNLETDFPMEGILRQNNASKEEYLARGYIFAEPNVLFWASDSEILTLYMPLDMTFEKVMAIVTGEICDMQLGEFMRSLLTVDESQMQALTETIAVNLRDSNEVFALLEQVTQHAPGDRSTLMESTIEELYITDAENIDDYTNGETIYDLNTEYEADESSVYNNGDTTETEEQSEEQAAT